MITVVIPLFNKERYIGDAVRSALDQSVSPQEVIVVDDGSTDSGPSIVGEFSDRRVKLRRQLNAGVSAARNAGIAEAKGEWIAFLDADDKWDCDHLEQLSKLCLRFKSSELVGVAYREVWSNGQVREVRPKGNLFDQLPDYFRASAFHPIMYTSSVMARRAALTEVGGFPVGVTHGEDLDTWARLAMRSTPAYSSRCTVSYSQGVVGQATRNRMGRPPIIDTLAEALAERKFTPITARHARYYLEVNLPRYLVQQRIASREFMSLLVKLNLKPLGLPASFWRFAPSAGDALKFVSICLKARYKLFLVASRNGRSWASRQATIHERNR